jgi:hypothetical protein
MRNLLKTSILVFAFCFCAFGQTNNTAPCPTVSVIGPPGIPVPNEPIIFTASLSKEAVNYKVNYNWTVSGGRILDGQGTETLRVTPNNLGESLTVTVEIIGLPADCANKVSETASRCGLPPQPIQIDVFSKPFTHIDKNRINEIVRALQNDPTAQLYIIFRHKEKNTSKMASQKEREISNSLVKAGLAADRITTITDFGKSESVEFWFVPAGATPPNSQDN